MNRFLFSGFAIALVAAGCAGPRAIIPSSIGSTQEIPDQAMRELAARIEQAVAEGDREHGIVDYEGIVVSTPELNQAIRTRAARREVLDSFLNTGFGWERADGMVHILRSSEYKKTGTGKSRDRDALIVISENRDRWTLYEGLVKANGYPRGELDRLRNLFAEARIATLEPGQKYERDGEAVVK